MNSAVVLIPAYRPAPELPHLLSKLLELDRGGCIRSIVVVDDGSGPSYAEVFRAAAALDRVSVMRHAVNLGKGAALKTGMNHVLVSDPATSGVVTADADGQHAPADILKVAQLLCEHPESLVLGVRSVGASEVPLRSRFGNLLTRSVFRVFTGIQVSDTQTGLRGIPRRHCLDSLRIGLNGYDFELESLIQSKGGGIREVPIETIYLDGNRSSHFDPLRDSMRIYFVFLRYCGSSFLAAAIDYLVFSLLYASTGNIAWSQAGGRVLAVIVAFTLARHVVFRSTGSFATSLAKYLLLVAVMGVVSYSLIQLLHTRYGLGVVLSKMMAEGLLFLGNFALQRDLIFTKRGSAPER